ncbi:histidine phosphatase family protein [Roseivivax sp. CAU 1753]
MQRRDVLLGFLSIGLAGCAAPREGVVMPPDTTLIVVRHGEKDDDTLTAAGMARANALASALGDVDIDRVYSTSYARNVATAEPVARAQGREVETLPDFDVAPGLLGGNAGKTILWVGNKGNISEIWTALSLPEPAPLNYGDLGVVRSDGAGRVSVQIRRFGAQ